MADDIKSKIITGISASEMTNRRISNKAGIHHGRKLGYMVLKTRLDNKNYYCCLSGGKLENGETSLTEVGNAAFEMLLALPVGSKADEIIMQEVKIGATPLSLKIKSTLRKFPSGSKVCFFGDMAGELDGVLLNVFNVSGTIEV